MRVCSQAGCGKLIPAAGYCDTHRRAKDQARGTRQARGYDRSHDQERARWQRILDQGNPVFCHNPGCKTPRIPIDPTSWHLGHVPDRSTWRGPEHPGCNLSEAGRASHGR